MSKEQKEEIAEGPKVKVLLVSSITHDGMEYLPGLHEIPEDLHDRWREEAPHIFSPIPVETMGKVQKAVDAPPEEKNQESSKTPTPPKTRNQK